MPDVDLTITIPEGSKQTKTAAAWTAQAGTHCKIEFTGVDRSGGEPRATYRAVSPPFEMPERLPGESLPAFGERFLLALGIASVKADGNKRRIDADKAAEDALVPAVNDVPDDVLT